MNELIKINTSNPDRPTVLGRDLHEALEVKTAYKDWFPRMCEYGFTEGEDFNLLKIERVATEGTRHVTRVVDDAQLTIPMAKEICMLQRTEKGKECRQYFIKVEEAWNTPEMIVFRAHQILQAQLDAERTRVLQLQARIEEDAPATLLGYAVSTADDDILIREMAKVLCQNGCSIGEKRLYERLRNDGYLIKNGSDRNMPTQRAIEMGLFRIKESVHTTPTGSFTTRTTKVTGKGQRYFIKKFLGQSDIRTTGN